MIVMKFGGTSVESAEAMRRVVGIVRKEILRDPLVVVSACAGATNDLLRIAYDLRDGKKERALEVLRALRKRHGDIASDLLRKEPYERVTVKMDALFAELLRYVDGVNLLGEVTNRSLDAFASFGERLSSLFVHAAIVEGGIPAELVDARTVMITDELYTNAVPLIPKIRGQVAAVFKPLIDRHHAIVTQGFIGATEAGSTTTIGRGGSDYSAAIFGAELHAEEIQIWTDVDGMMTADPRIVPGSRLIAAMSFDEASELAYFGAKVLHPKTILPAVENNIPVRILNSRRSEMKGTLILKSKTVAPSPNEVVKSIAFKKGITVINVSSSRMLMAHGFLAKLFSIFADHRKSIDVVATSEVSVSLTIDNEDGLPGILKELAAIGETNVRHRKAIICVVGEMLRQTPGIAARIFSALAKANVNKEMISEGASEINLTMVVDEQVVDDAVRALHNELFANA